MSVLDPISHVLAAVLAMAHAGLVSLGADPGSGTTWVLCVAVLVVVRAALLPLVAAIARIHQLLPALSAAGLLVAGGAVPVALLVYWVWNSIWTLGQSAVIRRWFPTPT